jgi:hypothetical protein
MTFEFKNDLTVIQNSMYNVLTVFKFSFIVKNKKWGNNHILFDHQQPYKIFTNLVNRKKFPFVQYEEEYRCPTEYFTYSCIRNLKYE